MLFYVVVSQAFFIKLSSFCTLKEQKTYFKGPWKVLLKALYDQKWLSLYLAWLVVFWKNGLRIIAYRNNGGNYLFKSMLSVVIFHIDQKKCRNLPYWSEKVSLSSLLIRKKCEGYRCDGGSLKKYFFMVITYKRSIYSIP